MQHGMTLMAVRQLVLLSQNESVFVNLSAFSALGTLAGFAYGYVPLFLAMLAGVLDLCCARLLDEGAITCPVVISHTGSICCHHSRPPHLRSKRV